jgi:hypothetical protein
VLLCTHNEQPKTVIKKGTIYIKEVPSKIIKYLGIMAKEE